MKQREVAFEVLMYKFIEFLIRLSLGLNSNVHRSAVSAPKSEDEHTLIDTAAIAVFVNCIKIRQVSHVLFKVPVLQYIHKLFSFWWLTF